MNEELLVTQWWADRRRQYNFGLVVAGILAFVLYVITLETRCANVPGVEITLFATLFQGVGYLVMIGVANRDAPLGEVK